jgi:hypothetical protein
MIAHDLARREDLIRDFIIAASKTYGDAIGNNEPKMPEIVDLYAMVNHAENDRVRGCCHALNHRHLFRAQSDRRRSQGASIAIVVAVGAVRRVWVTVGAAAVTK